MRLSDLTVEHWKCAHLRPGRLLFVLRIDWEREKYHHRFSLSVSPPPPPPPP
eukprot:COSAG03_NODE_20848_length_312_cov_1.774648_1_plen_51_part_10